MRSLLLVPLFISVSGCMEHDTEASAEDLFTLDDRNDSPLSWDQTVSYQSEITSGQDLRIVFSPIQNRTFQSQGVYALVVIGGIEFYSSEFGDSLTTIAPYRSSQLSLSIPATSLRQRGVSVGEHTLAAIVYSASDDEVGRTYGSLSIESTDRPRVQYPIDQQPDPQPPKRSANIRWGGSTAYAKSIHFGDGLRIVFQAIENRSHAVAGIVYGLIVIDGKEFYSTEFGTSTLRIAPDRRTDYSFTIPHSALASAGISVGSFHLTGIVYDANDRELNRSYGSVSIEKPPQTFSTNLRWPQNASYQNRLRPGDRFEFTFKNVRNDHRDSPAIAYGLVAIAGTEFYSTNFGSEFHIPADDAKDLSFTIPYDHLADEVATGSHPSVAILFDANDQELGRHYFPLSVLGAEAAAIAAYDFGRSKIWSLFSIDNHRNKMPQRTSHSFESDLPRYYRTVFEYRAPSGLLHQYYRYIAKENPAVIHEGWYTEHIHDAEHQVFAAKYLAPDAQYPIRDGDMQVEVGGRNENTFARQWCWYGKDLLLEANSLIFSVVARTHSRQLRGYQKLFIDYMSNAAANVFLQDIQPWDGAGQGTSYCTSVGLVDPSDQTLLIAKPPPIVLPVVSPTEL